MTQKITTPGRTLGANLDRDMKTIYSSHSALSNTAVKAPAFGAGFAMASGVASVVNGQKLGIPTGLASVDHVTASLNSGNGVPLNQWITSQPSLTVPGAIDIFIFKPTSNVDNTPIAATGTLVTHWIATGQASTTTVKFTQTSFNYQETGEVK